VNLITIYDCTGSNLGKFTVPPGVGLAGYDTGSAGIAWTPEQYARHPDALHFDQDPGASDYTADILDVERGAVPPGSPRIPEWYRLTLANYLSGKRPGQRHPAIYQSASNVTATVNALIVGGVTSGPGLVVANWSIGDPAATAEVQDAAGPFPVVGVQWKNTPLFDAGIYSGAWVNARSGAASPPPPPHPVESDQRGWKWCHLCGALFYGPDSRHVAVTQCPARSGPHDATGSGDYLLHVTTAR
jgi:hypothetical protein